MGGQNLNFSYHFHYITLISKQFALLNYAALRGQTAKTFQFWFTTPDLLKGPVVIVGISLHEVELGPGNTANGPVPAIPNPHV